MRVQLTMRANGHVESFHGRLRDECLNASWFRTLNDVRRTLGNWHQDYNCERPHSSLAYRTPAEFSRALGYGDVEGKQRRGGDDFRTSDIQDVIWVRTCSGYDQGLMKRSRLCAFCHA